MATAIHAVLIKLACSRPDEHNIPFEVVWTLDSLGEALEREAQVKLSRSEVWRILKGSCLRPHRVQQWLHSPDPEFRPKVEALCELYVALPAGATVLCVDEMTGIQALEPRFPLHPARPRRAARKEFEYRRHGTRTLIGALAALPHRKSDSSELASDRHLREVRVSWPR